MKINEVEQIVGITKKNIRFYEDQGLVSPERNKENGYRNYSEADILILQKIKLLRLLSVPIEEIRKMKENRLSLSECMDRHIIFLSHERKNLERIKEICEEISHKEEHLSNLDALSYLQKIKEMEEGGIHFMNVEKKDTRKKKIGPIIAAACMIVFMIFFTGLILWGNSVDPIPFGILLFLMIFPAAVVIGVTIALIQRIKEIEGGEEDEASKY